MGTPEWTLIGVTVFGFIFTAFSYLLNRKDAKQEELIKDLYKKHEEDAKKLTDLEIELAKNYNPKHEITGLFENFQKYLNERFDRLEQAIGVERRSK